LIADFSPATWDGTTGKFQAAGNVKGSVFSYGGQDSNSTIAATVDTTNQDLMLSGKVMPGDYSGGGLSFEGCVNTTAYTGVQFTLGGTAAGCIVRFQVQTFEEKPVSQGGGCATSCYQLPGAALTSTAGAVTVRFTDLAGGLPAPAAIASEIVGLQWQFESPPPAGDASQLGCTGIRLTVSNISFVP
jgi:hypothetical protein